jgi:nitroreductase
VNWEVTMSETVMDTGFITQAVQLACRAPSLHNSQPWRWVFDGSALHLFADPSRIGHHTDSTGREVIISCGAVLDHLRVAGAAAGWGAAIHRFPDTADQDHLASIEFRRIDVVTDAQRALAEAIAHRRTDRLPFAPPTGWESFETVLRNIVEKRGVDLDVVDDDGRPMLAHISRQTEHLRQHDASYEAELLWWTGYSDGNEGIPPSALVSDADTARVDVARHFPAAGDDNRRPQVERDHSLVLVLSTFDDSRENALCCGEVLSTVLLECTAAGLATCTLTQMIEIHTSREAVRRLTGNIREPQALIRVGTVPENKGAPPPPTPRRAVSAVLEIR